VPDKAEQEIAPIQKIKTAAPPPPSPPIEKADTDPRGIVAEAWREVHQDLPEPNARIDREHFVAYCMSKIPEEAQRRAAYQAYVESLHDTGLALMLPNKKTDLGKHCFGYSVLLAQEFYLEGKGPDCLALQGDPAKDVSMASVQQELTNAWETVKKDDNGRVTKDAFCEYHLDKYADRLVEETKEDYKAFLEMDFQTALNMMLPEEKTTLGGHCFRYGSLMAGEFYFDQAKQAKTKCGCAGQVNDVLGVAK